MWNASRFCVSSLRRGHANLLCIVPILTDDPRRESKIYVPGQMLRIATAAYLRRPPRSPHFVVYTYKHDTNKLSINRVPSKWPIWSSQCSLHNAPIFRLLLKVAVNGTHQCESLNFCGTYVPTTLKSSSMSHIDFAMHAHYILSNSIESFTYCKLSYLFEPTVHHPLVTWLYLYRISTIVIL